jgi:hypothetical protein
MLAPGELCPASNVGCPCAKCPEPPIPAFVTGQRIILAARGKNYEYRIRGIRVVFCRERQGAAIPTNRNDPAPQLEERGLGV